MSFSLLLRKQTTAQDFISPCPKVFTYEPQLSEPGKWYGTVTLIADADIIQVWLLIALDNPALEIGVRIPQPARTNYTQSFFDFRTGLVKLLCLAPKIT